METDRSWSSPADKAVIEALRRGDEEVFTRLVNQHHGTLRRIARLYLSSPAIADEVVQDTWLAVIRGVWAFEGRSTLKTWVLRILINRAKTRALRERRSVPLGEEGADAGALMESLSSAYPVSRVEDDEESRPGGRRSAPAGGLRGRRPTDLQDSVSSPETVLLSQEVRARIRAAIDSLPAKQRTVITMRDLEGCSSEEVCNVLGLSETNQRVILHRARSSVRTAMNPYLRRRDDDLP